MQIAPRKRIFPLLLVVVSFLLLAALAGCGEPSPTPTAPLLDAPTRTPKPTFTPVPKVTEEPTATPAPSATALPPTPTAVPSPTPNPNVSPLTGLPVDDPALLQRRVLAVRIGNDVVIRPQDGLSMADVVYEEIMEGYTLTRFTAIYLGTNAERLRPLRSARLSSLSIAPQYDAVLVHSGASDKIRWMIEQAVDFQDLDQYFHEQPYDILPGFDWRGRMYTSVEAVHGYLTKKGYETDGIDQGYLFETTPPDGAPANTVHIPYPQSCIVDWTYDPAQGRYLREVAGEPHLDGLTDQQLSTSNVIVLITEHGKTDIVEDSLGSTAIDIKLTGSGKALLVRDGVVIECTWVRPENGGLIEYFDADGQRVPLKPGNTWIEMVPPDYDIEVG